MAAKKTAVKKTAEKTETKAPAAKKAAAAKKAPAETGANSAEPSHAEIARLAHRFWQESGGRHGSHEDDWARAERELRGRK